MKGYIQISGNRTGVLTAPDQAREMIDHAAELSPAGGPEDMPLDGVRATYLLDAGPAGTMAPVLLDKANVGAPDRPLAVLLDALGARLAFERTGTRIYEALISKVRTFECTGRTFGSADGGPTEADLMEIWDEELAHFQLLHDSIVALGGDPTAVTPSADVEGVGAVGPLQIVSDPRLTLLQSMHAALVVELSDRESWEQLIGLADAVGQADLVEPFCACLVEEENHLTRVRGWISVLKERQLAGACA